MQVRARLRPDLVTQHAEIFLINGDMNSNLYTSSRAMHSSILSLLQAEGSNMSRAGVGRLQNMTVSVQRRWNNVLSDATRQVTYTILIYASLATVSHSSSHLRSSCGGGPWAKTRAYPSELSCCTAGPIKPER